MNIGNLTTAGAQLRDAHQKLLRQWDETQTHWKDDNARVLEEQYLSALNTEIRTTLQAVSQLTDLLQQGRRELSQ